MIKGYCSECRHYRVFGPHRDTCWHPEAVSLEPDAEHPIHPPMEVPSRCSAARGAGQFCGPLGLKFKPLTLRTRLRRALRRVLRLIGRLPQLMAMGRYT